MCFPSCGGSFRYHYHSSRHQARWLLNRCEAQQTRLNLAVCILQRAASRAIKREPSSGGVALGSAALSAQVIYFKGKAEQQLGNRPLTVWSVKLFLHSLVHSGACAVLNKIK